MAGQRKRYSADLKTKVAVEAIRGHKTANEIAAEYEAGLGFVQKSIRGV